MRTKYDTRVMQTNPRHGHTGTRMTPRWPAAFAHELVLPVLVAWRFRELIGAVLRQELTARFRGSLFGWGWAIVAPLVTLGLYTVTFSTALRLPIAHSHGSVSNYALWVFSGLIVFNLFAELSYRAPMLLHEHASRLKTSIFPSEILAWIAMLRGFVYAGISLVVLLAFQLVLTGQLRFSILLLPLLLIPFGAMLLGLIWFLAAIGAFARDVAHLMITVVPLMMIISPVFYDTSNLPDSLRLINFLNPLADAIEIMRALTLTGTWPSGQAVAYLLIISFLCFRGGYAFFGRYKRILVDVI